MDSRRGASGGVEGSVKAVCGVQVATEPSWIESKLCNESSQHMK